MMKQALIKSKTILLNYKREATMAMVLNNHVFKGHRALLGSKYVTYGELELPTREDVFSESKNGFDWGNSSKASLQLAFSILYQLGDKELAYKYAEHFMQSVVKNLNSRDWVLDSLKVHQWIEKNCEKPKMQKLEPLIKVKRLKKTNVVKNICKELNITQKHLAEILEIPEGTVSSWAVKNEIPRLGRKAIEFYILNVKNQKIVDSYRSFKNLLEAS